MPNVDDRQETVLFQRRRDFPGVEVRTVPTSTTRAADRARVGLAHGLAQRSRRAGGPPAQVAAEHGFVDQSHVTRHFKRRVGVTPAQDQRVGAGAH